MKDIIVLALIAVAAFWGSIIGPETVTVTRDEIKAVLSVEEPNEAILGKVDEVKAFEIEKTDSLKLAVFNYGFANRIEGYELDAQKVNDLYVQAAENMFDSSLKGKYPGYAEFVKGLIKSCFEQEKNHALSDLEKEKLSDTFSGLSWVQLWVE